MPTALLAVGDRALRDACRGQLRSAGYASVGVKRPLEILDLAVKLRWDLACVDSSALGMMTLDLLKGGAISKAPVVGIGCDADGLTTSLRLPLQANALASLLESFTAALLTGQTPARRLSLDPTRRLAIANGQTIGLTRIEFRLLEFLVSQESRDVPLPELLGACLFIDDKG